VLKECVRITDTVCRIGGEEFLVVLPCQTLQEGEVCAERCRQAIERKEFGYAGQTVRATVSAGIACRRGDMHTCADLLREADEALYAAKRAGRNVVRCARTGPENSAISAA
jgi:diguanylate cyclase (GGDEF)-like protein